MASIGIDLGGTKISAALFDSNGEILAKKKMEVPTQGGEEVGRCIISALGEIMEQSNSLGVQLHGVGICVPGIARRNGEVWAPNIPGWENYPLQSEVVNFLQRKIPVFVESDRSCHIMGETWKGAAINCRDVIFLVVGTGIGAGIMNNGIILRGAHGISGAIGWMALKPPFDQAYKERGYFETHASGFGIARRATQLLKDGMKSALLSPSAILAEDVFTAYDQHDPVAKIVITEAIQSWGMAAANMVSVFNPEKIIFGGGVFGPATRFIDRIYEEALLWAQPISIKQVKFEPSLLGSDAGLIGAGFLSRGN